MLKTRISIIIIFLLSLSPLNSGLEDRGLWGLDLNPFSAAAIFYLRHEAQASCLSVPKKSSIARLLLNRKHFLFMGYLALSPDMAGLLNDGQKVELYQTSDEFLWARLAGFPDQEEDPGDREAVRRSSKAVLSKLMDPSKDAWIKQRLSVLDEADLNGAHFKMIIKHIIGELNVPLKLNKNFRGEFLEFLEFWQQGFLQAALLEWGRQDTNGAEFINDVFTSYSRAKNGCDRFMLLKESFYKIEQLKCKRQMKSRLKDLFALFAQVNSLILGLPQKEVVIIPSSNIEADFKLYVCFKEDLVRRLRANNLIIKKKEERSSVKSFLQARERVRFLKKPLSLEANNLLLEALALEECFAVLSYDRGLRMDYKYKKFGNQIAVFEPMKSSCENAISDSLGQAGYIFYDEVLQGVLAQEVRNIPAILANEESEATLEFVRYLFDLNVRDQDFVQMEN